MVKDDLKNCKGGYIKMIQTKINVEVKVSKNYNSVMLGLSDHPITYFSTGIFTAKVEELGIQLVETAEKILSKVCDDKATDGKG